MSGDIVWIKDKYREEGTPIRCLGEVKIHLNGYVEIVPHPENGKTSCWKLGDKVFIPRENIKFITTESEEALKMLRQLKKAEKKKELK